VARHLDRDAFWVELGDGADLAECLAHKGTDSERGDDSVFRGLPLGWG
jgi:hypothetical protein